jgi:prevent-host-death family protein
MARELTQRELRNQSGEIMRALDHGERFVVTRRGIPVAELTPIGRRRTISANELLAALATTPRIDADQLRADLDAVIDQDPTPRA